MIYIALGYLFPVRADNSISISRAKNPIGIIIRGLSTLGVFRVASDLVSIAIVCGPEPNLWQNMAGGHEYGPAGIEFIK